MTHESVETDRTAPAASNTVKSNAEGINSSETIEPPTASDLEIGKVVEDVPNQPKGKTTERSGAGGLDPAQPEEQKPKVEDSKIKKIWVAVGLDAGTLMMMFKGSLPPLIAIAFYQAPSVSVVYGTLGYLVPIISVLSLCIMPRAKYIQTLILNTTGICIGSAVALLGIWSGVQARLHTTPNGSTASYNSSQSAVCAIWLFANIWFVNVMRAKIPALQFPVIMYSIFTNVAFTYGPVLPTIAAGESLIKELLEGFLTAFAISTGVSLFIVPISSRTVVFNELTGYIGAVRGTITAQTAYLQSLEKSDIFSQDLPTNEEESDEKSKKQKSNSTKTGIGNTLEALALKGAISGLTALHGKLHGDLEYGKREIAFGKLQPEDLDKVFHLFQDILIPLIGMSTITDIFERTAERRGWAESTDKSLFDNEEAWEHDPDVQSRLKEKKIWNDTMKQLHEPFAVVSQHMDGGLEHAGFVLELLPLPKEKSGKSHGEHTTGDVDVEAKGDEIKPGDAGYGDYLEKQLTDFYNRRGQALKTWSLERGITRNDFNEATSPTTDGSPITGAQIKHEKDRQQLYLILYMEYLLYSTGTAILKFIRYADSKREDGTMKKKKLVFPGNRRLYKWLVNLHKEDSTLDETTPDSLESNQSTIYMGSGFEKKKDPEHLPAKNAWEKFGNGVRTIPRFFGSAESAFGFRVACATMTIGIVAFLKDTQVFFMQQRLVWAMIIIAIGMTVTAGQSVFGFFTRIAGTALSMVFSIVIWYIVDQKTPGVIAMLWLFIFIEMYFFLKFPRFISLWLICIVTQVLIVGYELQVQDIGIKAASASGQPYYPIYELAPYRLATVAGGSFVAFIWTIFPFPLTDRSWLRKDLGRTIYILANYYSIVGSTIRFRLSQTEGDKGDAASPSRQLEKARHKIFGKLMLLIPSLHQHADWQKWEPGFGGKFPAAIYDDIITRITNIGNYLSLMTYATQTWSTSDFPNSSGSSKRAWEKDFGALMQNIEPTSHSITSILALLSASVTQGTALPPYMQMPEPYALSRRLEKLDKGILDAKHIEEPGYSAYAVVQVASSLVMDDLRRLVEDVKSLVGEVDFSFSVVTDTSTDSSTVDVGKENTKGKKD